MRSTVAFGVGAVVGAGLAMLFAPKCTLWNGPADSLFEQVRPAFHPFIRTL